MYLYNILHMLVLNLSKQKYIIKKKKVLFWCKIFLFM
ncbi:Uncharacterized protein GY17_00003973 [Cryptosporidium hominis]|uniref:Uncharacterized protein n=1 Tax=Cryptosporidium hominis TaxID=237895 RepID=A0ABX5B7F7_CRYHO|nr:Uncharacterized protein GY17_00003973 [Cryptosporidium hominis]|eukprot:PPS91973.1 Uncharacterized protein GY17_00003973 [Cryptosporidium hominis]